MTPTLPATRDLVLIGGGHTHALVVRSWGMNPLPGARLTLINPGPTAPYSGMLPGYVAGHYGRDDLAIDLVKLARFAGARIILGAVTALDPATRRISVGDRVISYDIASLDVGLTAEMPDLPRFAEHGVPVKPLGPFARSWDQARAGSGPIVVIGGGIAGAEVAMAMAHARQGRGGVTIVDAGQALTAVPAGPRRIVRKALAAQGITVLEGRRPVQLTPDGVHLDDGTVLPAEFVTGAASGRAWPWLSRIGLDTHEGFIAVDTHLRSSDPAVFAAGDCAHMRATPRPKAGVYAVRQAPVLLHNLKAALMEQPLRTYTPQKDYLKLVSLGGKRALAERGGVPLSGAAMWRWKDRIDRRFMDQFATLKPMAAPAVPKERAAGAPPSQPLCAGCGAKVGRGALTSALAGLPRLRSDVLTAPGDDAAILQTGGAQQVLTTDHLRAFTQDPGLMAQVAAVHALGDIWAMGAAPQAVLAQIILPRCSADLQARSLEEIMQAAGAVFADAGAQIVGGHTTQGDEMTIGFSITGLCETPPITLDGAQPGDALILTKPLGTGVILAAEMQLKARGAVVAGAYASMSQPSAKAAQILSKAHAMTDVTGFGLAGHLQGICAASRVSAQLWLDRLPLLEGAEGLAASGIRSSLYPENRALIGTVPETPRSELLFDPQTAGGLLAAVDPACAEKLREGLRSAGYPAEVIGEINSGDVGVVFVS